MCQHPNKTDMHGFELDIWVCFFVLSKLAEFGDTVLKILLQKPFIFLHWYHHVRRTTIAGTWVAFSQECQQ